MLEPKKARSMQVLQQSTIGIGDAVAGVTKAAGIKPCGACKKRQTALNRATPGWVSRLLAWITRLGR